MKKKNLTFAVLLLAVVLTTICVSGTYARYITEDTGEGQAKVAKWNAVIDGWKTVSSSKVLELVPEEDNKFVAAGLIAPDVTVEGKLDVQLTGTQVATDLKVKLGTVTIDDAPVSLSDIATHFDTTLEVIDKDSEKVIGTISSSDDVVTIGLKNNLVEFDNLTVKVGLKWKHSDTTTGWNAWDTSLGEYGSGDVPVIKAELIVTAQQHVTSDGAYTPASAN